MEFPGLGENCGVSTCNRLDFLPVKCDACNGVFCKDHFTYNDHQCRDAYRKDNQVPVCPLCNRPIPVAPGQTPDQRVSQHIDTDCQSDPAREHRGKIFKNRCSLAGCKKKELLPVQCPSCRQNFCLTHRLEADHSCRGFQGSGRTVSASAAAAIHRQAAPVPRPSPVRQAPRTGASHVQAVQAGMSEDEALAMALRLSAAEAAVPDATAMAAERERQEREDRQLAEALAASELENRQRQQRRQENVRTGRAGNDNCAVS